MTKNYYIKRKACLLYHLLIREISKTIILIGLLLCIPIGNIWASSSYAQITTLSLNMNQKPIVEILEIIEKQTDFHFFYNSRLVNVDRKVSVNVNQANVFAVLDQMFDKTDVVYKVVNTDVILSVNNVPIALQNKLKSITGVVKDHRGDPIIGANVVEKGTTNGTMTNIDGEFTLQISDGAILQVSYIGYITKEIPVAHNSNFAIVLDEDTKIIDEVVVVGYGTQKKATLTGSITTVKGEDMIKAPTTNATHMLAGRLPGLTAIQRSGEPGADDAVIRIRGVNTLGENNPLVVVDGVPGRSLSRIDPSSIETITVLKDASAAIYGSQAANGVILITTKRGSMGKPTVTINFNQGFSRPTRIPEMCDGSEYATLLNELDLYEGRTPRYTEEEIKLFTSGSDPWKYPNTDWFKEVLKPWSAQNNLNAQLAGGKEELQYFVSAGTKYQDAFYRNSVSDYRQFDFRSNLDAKISEYVKVAIGLYGRLEDTTSPTRGFNTIFRTTTMGNPNIHAVWPNGAPGPDILEGSNPVTISTNAAGYDRNKVYTLNSNFKLDIKVPWIEGLSFSGSANFDKAFQNRKRLETPWEVNTWDGKSYDDQGIPVLNAAMVPFNDPRLSQYMYDNQSLLLNGILDYKKEFGKHELGVMVGMESREGKGNNFNAYRRHFVSVTIPELFAGGGQDKDNDGGSYENARLNYFGRANYNFGQKYLLEFIWRYDGSYMFPAGHRFGFFPGVSLGWRVSEEAFWKKNVPFIEEFKLRASYGQTGNDQIGEWQYLSSYGYSSYVYNFGINESNKLLYEARIPNENITWEVANQANVGFDSYFLDNKLYFEFDYFNYKRSKILWWRNASVPSSTGLTLPRENIGKVKNQGFDFMISYRDRASDFEYNISLSGGYSRNKITFWDETPGNPEWQRSTGKCIPSNPNDVNQDLYYIATGIFRDQAQVDATPHWENARPGDIIFKDINNDGVIDGLDRVRNDKNNIPRFTGGLNIGLNYKQFDLSLLFQGAAGAVRFLSVESGQIGNFLKDFYDERWTPDNPDSKGPRAYNRDAEYWRNNRNTFFLYNSDYIRLKTLELGYSLPASINQKIGISGLRVYVSGYNLFTFSPSFKNFDPESNSSDIGGQGQPYPAQKVINTGISLTF